MNEEKNDSAELSNDTKMLILRDSLQTVYNTIYKFTIDCRIAKKVKDESLEKNAMEQLKKFEMMKDEYEKEIAQLKAEMKGA